MTAKDIMNTLENIVKIFSDYEGEISTNDLLNEMQHHFNYKQQKRSLENHLDRLDRGELDGVILTKAPQRSGNKTHKHHLSDQRVSAIKNMHKQHQKIMTEEKLIAEEKMYMRLALQAIKELPELSNIHYKKIEKRFKLDDLDTPYFIESEETELLKPKNYNTSELIYAINNDAFVAFKYSGESRKDNYIVEPYKLITFDGLWYLFAKDIEDNQRPFKTWRLKYIDVTDIDRSSKHNTPDKTIENLLSKAHSADFIVKSIDNATVESIHIEVKVSKEIEDMIQLPGEIEEVLNHDGSRTITCDVSSTKEIDRDIKSWLPHIEILEPKWYREKLNSELREYLLRKECI